MMNNYGKKMFYSIGEAAKLMGVPTSTIRYYERMGLFPDLERSSGGIRVFSDSDIRTLKMIDCLKCSGLPIKDINIFLGWVREGESTLEDRRNMFYERKEVVEAQMVQLQKVLDKITYKCWYYDTAIATSEKQAKEMSDDEIPEEMLKLKNAM